MKQFGGFPVRSEYAPIPFAFFSALLPEITDMAELKITLHLFRMLIPMKRNPQFVTFDELAGDANLILSIKNNNDQPKDTIQRALKLEVGRGNFLQL